MILDKNDNPSKTGGPAMSWFDMTGMMQFRMTNAGAGIYTNDGSAVT